MDDAYHSSHGGINPRKSHGILGKTRALGPTSLGLKLFPDAANGTFTNLGTTRGNLITFMKPRLDL